MSGMKKYTIVLFLLIIPFMIMCQEEVENDTLDQKPEKFKKHIQFGATAGITLNTYAYNFSGEYTFESFDHISYMVGMRLDWQLGRLFSIQIPLTLKSKGDRSSVQYLYDNNSQVFPNEESISGDGSIKQTYLSGEFPLVFSVGFGDRYGKYLSLGAGPFVSLGITGKEKNSYTLNYADGTSESFDFDRDIEFTDTFGTIRDVNTRYLKFLDYGYYGEVTYKFKMYTAGLSVSIGHLNIDNENDWAHLGILGIPNFKSISIGIFGIYLL